MKTSEIISILALLISAFTYLNSNMQTEAAIASLSIANEQAKIAKLAYEASSASYIASNNLADKNFRLAKESFELQKKQLDEDMELLAVFDTKFLDALDSPITNQQKFELLFKNKTTKTIPYRVIIESDGFGVYFNNSIPEKIVNAIRFERERVVLSPNEYYPVQHFVVWHSTTPSKVGKIRVKVNERVVLEKNYTYGEDKKAYLPNR